MLRALVILVALCIGIYFVALPGRRGGTPPDREQAREALLARADLNALKGSPDSPDFFAALLRRSRLRDQAARQPAIDAAKSTDSLLREASAQALGNYSGADADSALLALTRDPNPAVRIPAIESLGVSPAPSRKQEISILVSAQDPLSRAAAQVALLRLARDPESKSAALAKISETVVGNGAIADGRGRAFAFQRALSLEPNHPATLKMARELVSRGEPALASSALRHLAFLVDPWLKTSLGTLIAAGKEPGLRQSLVESMHQVCPKDRWDTLDRLIREESDPDVRRAAIQEASVMVSPEAQALLRKWIAFKRLKVGEIEPVEAALVRMAQHPVVDPCESVSNQR